MRIGIQAPVIVLLAWLSLQAAAHAADVAAVVVDFDGAATRVSNGTRSELKLGSTLAAGDEVTVAPGGSVTLRAAGRCLLITQATETPPPPCERIAAATYRVEAKTFAGALSDRFAALSDVLSWWDPEATRKPMRSRDSYRPEILSLKDTRIAPLVEGKRDLAIRWVDGAPPFALTLEGPGGPFAARLADGDQRRATISATIKAGAQYRLVLKDGTRVTHYDLRGIAAGEAKELPSAEADPLEQAASLLGAISDSKGAWAFEALQHIHALKLEPRVKTALTDAIELGDWP